MVSSPISLGRFLGQQLLLLLVGAAAVAAATTLPAFLGRHKSPITIGLNVVATPVVVICVVAFYIHWRRPVEIFLESLRSLGRPSLARGMVQATALLALASAFAVLLLDHLRIVGDFQKGGPWLPLLESLAWRAPLSAVAFSCLAASWEIWRNRNRFGALAPLKDLDEVTQQTDAFTVVHLSDLHATSGAGVATIEGDSGVWAALQRLAEMVSRHVEENGVVLITGDLTDSGAQEEWSVLRHALSNLDPNVRARLILLPGNHDLNVVSRNWRLCEPADLSGRSERQVRFLQFLLDFQECRTLVLVPTRGADARTIASVELKGLRERMKELGMLREEGRLDPGRVGQHWEHLYPMVAVIGTTVFVALDTCATTRTSLSNAFGEVPEDALGKLHRVRDHFPDAKVILCMHHHLEVGTDLPRTALGRRIQEGFMAVANRGVMWKAIRVLRPSAVFHGHRHISRAFSLTEIPVFGAPSATCGGVETTNAATDLPPGFYVYSELPTRGWRRRFVPLFAGRPNVP